jgi:hypothetical protein
VSALCAAGGTLFVGGSFDQVGTESRHNAAAFDLSTRALSAWNPDPNQEVDALAASSTRVYLGGSFTQVGTESRRHLAAVDGQTGGLVVGWDPHPDSASPAGVVRAILPSGQAVYVGGDFSQIGGQARRGVAALDAETGLATDWTHDAGDLATTVSALALSEEGLLVGGSFPSVGAEPYSFFAILPP